MWTITDKQIEAISESIKKEAQKRKAAASGNVSSENGGNATQTLQTASAETQTPSESGSQDGTNTQSGSSTEDTIVISPCEPIDVIQVSVSVNSLIDQVLIEKHDPKNQSLVSAVSDTKILYGELFRLCVACNREPDKKEIPKKIILNGIGYKNEKTVPINGKNCVVNYLTASKNLSKLELMQDEKVKNKFHTNWMLVPVTDYMGTDKLEAEEIYNYQEKKSDTEEERKAHTTINSMLPEIKFSTADSDGVVKPVISDITHEQASLSLYIYTRNYEELIGINKNESEFYEDYFIGKGPKVKTVYKEYKQKIEESYDNYYTKTEDQILTDLESIVKTYADRLWKAAVDDVKSTYDDRPLYWARNKMQVYLKRHPIFKQDINFVFSRPGDNTKLDKLIKLFEELSRNYTGIDFSGAGDKKKLLITGFDPFILNPQKNDDILQVNPSGNDGNILQVNPSGCAALKLHGRTIGGYYIQAFIFPVRYKDFDAGCVEDYIKNIIYTFNPERDMIITMSQGYPFRFDVDRFPCRNRGGYMDNMFWGNSKQEFNSQNFKQLAEGKEFYETTLPYKKIVPDKNDSKELFFIYLNQTYHANNGIDGMGAEKIEGSKLRAKLEDIQTSKSTSGSGGNYLSNEIFYRVARMRSNLMPTLQTGHLHLPLIQASQENKIGNLMGYRNSDLITIDHSPYMKNLIENIEQIIKKIE